MSTIVKRNPYARAEYIGEPLKDGPQECLWCGSETNIYWYFEPDSIARRRHNVGPFCDFDCLCAYNDVNEQHWS